MRVIHAPSNMAGQATILSAALRDLGIESDVVVFNRHPFGYTGEISLDLDKRAWIVEKIAVLALNFARCAVSYDIFHLHFGRSLLPHNMDLPLLKLMGKKVIMHYWGDDVRQNDVAAAYTCLGLAEMRHIYPFKNDDAIRNRINKVKKYIDISIVGDYSLRSYSPHSIVIRQAIDLDGWQYVGTDSKEKRVTIVHAPSNREIKGTGYILPVIARLKNEGYEIDFVLLENMSNMKVKQVCEEADLVIDQLLLESYGIFAIECMALGKPVLCRIDEHFKECYPHLPIVNTDPKNLYHNLKMLIEDPCRREALGEMSRRYVEEVHDVKRIARQLADLYRSL
jgi:ribosomal protein L30/L7E